MDLKLFLQAQWDRVAAVSCVLLGAIALLLGWLGVSDTALSGEQVPYVVSGGLGGIALIGVGATLWLSADLRDEWRKLHHLDRDLRDVMELVRDSATVGIATTNGTSQDGEWSEEVQGATKGPGRPRRSQAMGKPKAVAGAARKPPRRTGGTSI